MVRQVKFWLRRFTTFVLGTRKKRYLLIWFLLIWRMSKFQFGAQLLVVCRLRRRLFFIEFLWRKSSNLVMANRTTRQGCDKKNLNFQYHILIPFLMLEFQISIFLLDFFFRWLKLIVIVIFIYFSSGVRLVFAGRPAAHRTRKIKKKFQIRSKINNNKWIFIFQSRINFRWTQNFKEKSFRSMIFVTKCSILGVPWNIIITFWIFQFSEELFTRRSSNWKIVKI